MSHCTGANNVPSNPRRAGEAFGASTVRQTHASPEVVQASTAGAPAQSANRTRILLTDEQSAEVLGVSVRKFHELRKESWFPRAVILGPRVLRWAYAELEGAVANMPRQDVPQPEPRQLLRGRIERMKATGVPA